MRDILCDFGTAYDMGDASFKHAIAHPRDLNGPRFSLKLSRMKVVRPTMRDTMKRKRHIVAEAGRSRMQGRP
jgi:uncharacterized UPF0160 family protein